jgi:outer membrane protein OmpA-like peptidoglycan-associated protein/tetratricopeptide (TPR) repeat protein
MKTKSILTVIFLHITLYFFSQNNTNSFEKDFDNAEKVFSEVYHEGENEAISYYKGSYSTARPLLINLYKQDTTNANIAFKIGVCYLSSRNERDVAIRYFKKAITSVSSDYKESSYKEKHAPIIAYKFLGDAYHLNYQFDNAIDSYNKFLGVMDEYKITNKKLQLEAKQKIEMCVTGKYLVTNPINIKIENLGINVNSAYADYSPVISADQNVIFFTSRRPESTGGEKDEDGNFYEDIYMCEKTPTGWAPAKNVGTSINTNEHEATVGISPDGQTILIYKDDKGDGNIYSTSLKGEVWGAPVKLNENINSKYWEPSAFISADGNTLYFTSSRPGGYGGRDLYSSKKTPKGDWAKAVNLGPAINTAYDEDAPCIQSDGVTLAFSSNGHNTMGGFDVFSSQLSGNGTWSVPENVGYPINTTDDDIFYVISPDGRNAYYSSFRKEGRGEKDNYKATFIDRKETPLTLMKGKVINESGKPANDVEITVTDNATEEIVGIYHTNSKSGQYIFILTPGKNYNITYQQEDHLFYSENMEIPMETNYYEIYKAIILPPIVVGSKITLNNIFFDFDKATLRTASNVELKNLVKLMKNNPTIKVEISGHTDSKGTANYNQKLSEERAKAVVNYMKYNGISAKRMVAKGYGQTVPSAPNENSNGTDNPEGRQLNRRVELKIIAIN